MNAYIAIRGPDEVGSCSENARAGGDGDMSSGGRWRGGARMAMFFVGGVFALAGLFWLPTSGSTQARNALKGLVGFHSIVCNNCTFVSNRNSNNRIRASHSQIATGNGAQAKPCEGSSNRVKHVGVASVVCCAAGKEVKCDHAAVGDSGSPQKAAGSQAYNGFPGWGFPKKHDYTDYTLYGFETTPCDVSAFIAKLGPGEGYFYESRKKYGWCKPISPDNVAILRDNRSHTTGWYYSAVGTTFLPKAYDGFPGWGYPTKHDYTDLTLYGRERAPCDVSAFIAKLGPDEGYYHDKTNAGFCKTISPDNVAILRDNRSHTTGWYYTTPGATYLPKVALH